MEKRNLLQQYSWVLQVDKVRCSCKHLLQQVLPHIYYLLCSLITLPLEKPVRAAYPLPMLIVLICLRMNGVQ